MHCFCCESCDLKKLVTVVSSFMNHNKYKTRFINRDTFMKYEENVIKYKTQVYENKNIPLK